MAKPPSDWHEQIEFSELYFEETKQCRTAQRNADLVSWKECLLSKISIANGILDDAEQVDGWYSKLQMLDQYLQQASSLSPSSLAFIKLKRNVDKTLFNVERELDMVVNKKMPFLNIKKKADIRGL